MSGSSTYITNKSTVLRRSNHVFQSTQVIYGWRIRNDETVHLENVLENIHQTFIIS